MLLQSSFPGVRGKLDSVPRGELPPRFNHPPPPASEAGAGLEAELARVHAMLAHNSKVYKVFGYTMHFLFLFFIL